MIKPLIAIIEHMYNFIVKSGKIPDIFKNFAGNRVDKNGNRPHCGVVPKFSDLEVIALSATAEAFGIDSENYLFRRLNAEKGDALPDLITRRRYNQRRRLTARTGEEIRKDIVAAIDGKEGVFSVDSKPVRVCRNARAARCAMGKDDCDTATQWGFCASQACTTMNINFTQSAE